MGPDKQPNTDIVAVRCQLKEHYGPMELNEVDSETLLLILDELGEEMARKMGMDQTETNRLSKCDQVDGADASSWPDGFYLNRRWIIDAYKKDQLVSLEIPETESMYLDIRSRDDPIFMRRTHAAWPFGPQTTERSSVYKLPCFAIVSQENVCDILWVAERARGNGIAKALAELTDIKRAHNVLPGSESFWTQIGFVRDPNNSRDFIKSLPESQA